MKNTRKYIEIVILFDFHFFLHSFSSFIFCVLASQIELFKFTCPKVDESAAVAHPRYADPEDCQFFYVCINGEQPRRNGCKLGQAFDDVSKRCDWARKIPEW